jgi:heme-degrading monooxygenase HmoA
MYVSRAGASISLEQQDEFVARIRQAHAALAKADGFRWAMLLRSMEDPAQLAAVAMWLTREHAAASGEPPQHYDVTTARGSMTPAAVMGIVEWHIDPDGAQGFVSWWNAAYHAIEDSIGSRLLHDLDDAAHYTGIHVAASEAALKPDVLASALSDGGGLDVRPESVTRYEVILLHEA